MARARNEEDSGEMAAMWAWAVMSTLAIAILRRCVLNGCIWLALYIGGIWYSVSKLRGVEDKLNHLPFQYFLFHVTEKIILKEKSKWKLIVWNNTENFRLSSSQENKKSQGEKMPITGTVLNGPAKLQYFPKLYGAWPVKLIAISKRYEKMVYFSFKKHTQITTTLSVQQAPFGWIQCQRWMDSIV